MTTHKKQTKTLRCKRCSTILPLSATFCSKCGERITTTKLTSSPSRSKQLIAGRYRVTSLIRRHPYIRLSFALDIQQQRPVVIRDIDISSLDDPTRAQASAIFHQEYDLLRRKTITDLMPFIATHGFQGHLYSISGPSTSSLTAKAKAGPTYIYTLQDLLQSGIGLPDERQAIAWVTRLGNTIDHLHASGIILGEIDPQSIACTASDYSGDPSLIATWIPMQIRKILPQASNTANTRNFVAPEVLQEKTDARSDIYSLGAILHLLLGGRSPELVSRPTRKRRTTRSLRDFNPHVSTMLDMIVQRALAADPDQRFQTARAMVEALQQHIDALEAARHQASTRSTRLSEKTGLRVQEKTLSSDKNSSENGRDSMILPGSEGETVRIASHQAQAARSYSSNVPTQATDSLEKQSGEARVKEVQTSQEPGGNVVAEEQALLDIPTTEQGTASQSVVQQVMIDDLEKEIPADDLESDDSATQLLPRVPKKPEVPPQQPVEEQETLLLQSVHEVRAARAQQRQLVDYAPVPVMKTLATATRDELDQQMTTSFPLQTSAQATAVPDMPTVNLHIKTPAVSQATSDEVVDAIKDSPQASTAMEATREVYDIPTVRISQDEFKAAQEVYRKEKALQEEQKAARPVSETMPSEFYPSIPEGRALIPSPPEQRALTKSEQKENPLTRIKDMITGSLPALPRLIQPTAGRTPEPKDDEKNPSFLRQVKRFLLGSQQHRTAAAALIETPMRVQPNQSYAIRIHLMGRDEPRDGEQSAGLSALIRGTVVHIEVRSALYQNYAYIVQQADVETPAAGFSAEVTMPMRPFAQGPNPRRERLHIFFMDVDRNPLYEKPFVVELFISPLVQSGREGHNVLSIPL